MKMKESRFLLLAVTVGLLFFASLSVLDAQAQGVKIGEKLPEFTLTDYEGNSHNLSDFKGQVVMIEMCSHKCPWSVGADKQLKELYEKYSEKGVVFLGIDSHNDTPPAEIKEYAQKVGKPYPILKDENNVYADKLKATRTPEVFILDKEGVLVYHGAFDNRTKPEEAGDVNYVADALDAVLAGNPVERAQVAAWGCTIKRVEKTE